MHIIDGAAVLLANKSQTTTVRVRQRIGIFIQILYNPESVQTYL